MADLLPVTTRLWFAWVCFFRVLFDADFAARTWRVRNAQPALAPARELSEEEPLALENKLPAAATREKALPAPAASSSESAPRMPAPPPKDAAAATEGGASAALQLLALLQREGRLVDFLEQEITGFPDVEIGAAARVVHEGCRKALHEHAELTPVRTEAEGEPVTLIAGYNPDEVKLTGNVQGSAPYKGVLRHRGWRVKTMSLPVPMKGHDTEVIAPAEVEL